jgi:hypothetical protein
VDKKKKEKKERKGKGGKGSELASFRMQESKHSIRHALSRDWLQLHKLVCVEL